MKKEKLSLNDFIRNMRYMQQKKGNLYKSMKFNFGSVDIDDMGVFEPIADVYDFSSKSWRMIYIAED